MSLHEIVAKHHFGQLVSIAFFTMAFSIYIQSMLVEDTRDVFYVRREVDLMKTAKVKAYIMHIFGKIELLSINATLNYFKINYFNAF